MTLNGCCQEVLLGAATPRRAVCQGFGWKIKEPHTAPSHTAPTQALLGIWEYSVGSHWGPGSRWGGLRPCLEQSFEKILLQEEGMLAMLLRIAGLRMNSQTEKKRSNANIPCVCLSCTQQDLHNCLWKATGWKLHLNPSKAHRRPAGHP